MPAKLPCLIAASTLLAGISCSPPAPEPTRSPASGAGEARLVAEDPHGARIIETLRALGYDVRETDVSRAEFLRQAPGHAYRIDDEWLHLHVFQTTEDAAAVRSSLADPASTATIGWVAPPHFYQCGKLAALYLGKRPPIERAIEEICGPSFP